MWNTYFVEHLGWVLLRCQARDQEKTGIELPDVRMYSRVFTKVLPTFNDVMQHVYVINDNPVNLQQEIINMIHFILERCADQTVRQSAVQLSTDNLRSGARGLHRLLN